MNENIMKNCTLCPRMCGADRISGQKGCCGQTADIYAARAALHMWEEPCISGENGSGTVFFSGCPLKCVYCQNFDIANANHGKKISADRLCEIYFELEEKGANNINLVTPTHYIPHIINSLAKAKSCGLKIPTVYNTSGYERPESIRMLEGLIDVYLPDFKYFSADTAKKYSNAPDYPEYAKAAIEEMVRQTGNAVFDAGGIMQKGVIVRHLVLPGYTAESERIIKYLYSRYGDDIYMSIMNQYTPLENVKKNYPELDRRVTDGEYEDVVDFAVQTGVENGFVQEGGTAEESFIPMFDFEGI